jgi:hypothetical protein
MLGGDEIAVKGAAVRTDFTSPRSVLLGYLPRLAPGAGGLARLRAAGVAATRSRQITDGYTRANWEVAALTARQVGLGAGVEAGLGDIFEAWNGRGGPEAAVGAVRARAGKALDPAPAVRVGEEGIDAVCRAFGEAVDLKSPFHHGHSTGVALRSRTTCRADGRGRASDLRTTWLASTDLRATRGRSTDLGTTRFAPPTSGPPLLVAHRPGAGARSSRLGIWKTGWGSCFPDGEAPEKGDAPQDG